MFSSVFIHSCLLLVSLPDIRSSISLFAIGTVELKMASKCQCMITGTNVNVWEKGGVTIRNLSRGVKTTLRIMHFVETGSKNIFILLGSICNGSF